MTVDITKPTVADGLSLEELDLYHLIMDYRIENGLDPVPLSTGLTATAGRHTYDTLYNIWEVDLALPAGTNLHSWSDAPYYADHRDPEAMWDAPGRYGITYPSSGYEISVAGLPTIGETLNGWKGSPSHNNVILNRDIWTNIDFKAVGVGVEHDPSVGDYLGQNYGGHIYHVWFGASVDPNGAPVINGTPGADNIRGTAFADRVVAGAGDDSFQGHEGADTLVGGTGNDTVEGGSGNDQIWAGAGDAGNDRLLGGSGNDTLGGGAGNDSGWGGTGADNLYGGEGADRLHGEQGGDVIWAGPGGDIVYAGTENDTFGGGTGQDTLFAGAGNDIAYGSTGNDDVDGEVGADTLFGGDGNDTITGGSGDDEMYGGDGNDVLVFAAGHGNDTIGGFETKGDNLIDLSALNLNGFSSLAVTENGADVVIDTGGGTITMWNTSQGQITSDDFIF